MSGADLAALRKKARRVLTLPEPAQKTLEHYLHISVDGVEVACPYHINPGLHAGNRALLGKGSPHEIEELAAKWFKQYDMHISDGPEQLRTFLRACGIGVDCSGFASWVLNCVTLTKLGQPIWKCLKFPGARRMLASKIRPIENISANLLTGLINATPVDEVGRVRPGDLIRAAGWHHVVVVTEVGIDKAEQAAYFQYAQSSCMYDDEAGVRTGYAIIKKPRGSLLAQAWHDNYQKSVIEELIAEGGDDSRLVRLRVLAATKN